MPNAAPERIRIILRWIQVLETHEPFFKKSGEFRFVATVSAGEKQREQNEWKKNHEQVTAEYRASVQQIEKESEEKKKQEEEEKIKKLKSLCIHFLNTHQ